MKKGWELFARITREELDGYSIIDNHIRCASQALRPSVIDPQATQDQIDKFVMAQNRALANYTFLMSDWWNSMREKYRFGNKHVHIDFEEKALIIEV